MNLTSFFVVLVALVDDDAVAAAFRWLFGLFRACLWSLVDVFGCCALVGGAVGSDAVLSRFVSDFCGDWKGVDVISESIARIAARKVALLSPTYIDDKNSDNMLNLVNCRKVID